MSFVEDEHLVLLPLGGGEVRRLPSAGAGRRGPPLSLDDWRLDEVPWEGGSVLIARHLPTGLGTRLRFNADFVQARGGAAGLLMWEQRAAGRSGELRLGASPVRLFEEDGTAHGGADLATRPGGHGGNHGWLAAGQVREAELDPGPNGGILDLFVEGDFGEGELQVLRDGTLVARRSWPEAPPETEADTGDDSGPGGWMTLAEITRLPKASPEARRISLRWTAGGKGLRVDAVALRTPIPGNAL